MPIASKFLPWKNKSGNKSIVVYIDSSSKAHVIEPEGTVLHNLNVLDRFVNSMDHGPYRGERIFQDDKLIPGSSKVFYEMDCSDGINLNVIVHRDDRAGNKQSSGRPNSLTGLALDFLSANNKDNASASHTVTGLLIDASKCKVPGCKHHQLPDKFLRDKLNVGNLEKCIDEINAYDTFHNSFYALADFGDLTRVRKLYTDKLQVSLEDAKRNARHHQIDIKGGLEYRANLNKEKTEKALIPAIHERVAHYVNKLREQSQSIQGAHLGIDATGVPFVAEDGVVLRLKILESGKTLTSLLDPVENVEAASKKVGFDFLTAIGEEERKEYSNARLEGRPYFTETYRFYADDNTIYIIKNNKESSWTDQAILEDITAIQEDLVELTAS